MFAVTHAAATPLPWETYNQLPVQTAAKSQTTPCLPACLATIRSPSAPVPQHATKPLNATSSQTPRPSAPSPKRHPSPCRAPKPLPDADIPPFKNSFSEPRYLRRRQATTHGHCCPLGPATAGSKQPSQARLQDWPDKAMRKDGPWPSCCFQAARRSCQPTPITAGSKQPGQEEKLQMGQALAKLLLPECLSACRGC